MASGLAAAGPGAAQTQRLSAGDPVSGSSAGMPAAPAAASGNAKATPTTGDGTKHAAGGSASASGPISGKRPGSSGGSGLGKKAYGNSKNFLQ